MFATPRRGQNTEFQRQKLSGRFAPSCIKGRRIRWIRGLAAAWLIVAVGGIRSAHGDDSWSVAAPVIELDEEVRANSRLVLPPVVSKQEAGPRPVSTSKIAAPVVRRGVVGSLGNDTTLARKLRYGETAELSEAVHPQPLPTQTIPQGPATAHAEPPTEDDEIFRPIQQVRVDIAPGKGELPQNRAAIRFAKAGEQVHVTGFSRSEPETHFEWDAPALCHRPLFFEDVNLERHGYHVKYFQPFLSAGHFFSRVPALPYLAASQRSRVCNYTLGHYRPGSYAPYVWYYPRPSLTGTVIEGAVVTGLILAIP